MERIEQKERRQAKREAKRQAKLKKTHEAIERGETVQEDTEPHDRSDTSDDDGDDDDNDSHDKYDDEGDAYNEDEGEIKGRENEAKTHAGKKAFGEIGGDDDYQPWQDPLFKAMAQPGGVLAMVKEQQQQQQRSSRVRKDNKRADVGHSTSSLSSPTKAGSRASDEVKGRNGMATTQVKEAIAYYQSFDGIKGVDDNGKIQVPY